MLTRSYISKGKYVTCFQKHIILILNKRIKIKILDVENLVVVHNAVASMSLEDIKGIGYLTNHLVINLKRLISKIKTHQLQRTNVSFATSLAIGLTSSLKKETPHAPYVI